MAVTPIPPAVHTEISPRLALASFASSLARLATMRVPVAANGWPIATLPPFTLSLARSMLPSGAGQAEHVAAVLRRFPGLERAQHLRGERFVDLVVVEILQRDARVLEHRGHGVRGRHQQAFLAADVVDRPRLAVA